MHVFTYDDMAYVYVCMCVCGRRRVNAEYSANQFHINGMEFNYAFKQYFNAPLDACGNGLLPTHICKLLDYLIRMILYAHLRTDGLKVMAVWHRKSIRWMNFEVFGIFQLGFPRNDSYTM